MMRRSVILIVLFVLFIPLTSYSKQLTLAWRYNSYFYKKVTGFKIYSGVEEGKYSTLVANVKKVDVTTTTIQPILLEEHFDTNPGTKYTLTKGRWTWVSETKNMKIEGGDFMIVFEYPAGISSAMWFSFWPSKSTGDQPQILSYIKDEAASTNGGVYYELRLAADNGTRYSNWRKVYDQKYGGVDPIGAFPLPRYKQCVIVENQNNLCPGFSVNANWDTTSYSVNVGGKNSLNDAYAIGLDTKPLDINKVEIIINQQEGWIDDIVIGGEIEVTANPVEVQMPATGPIYLVATAYNSVGESGPSIPIKYEVITEEQPNPLPTIKNMRIQ